MAVAVGCTLGVRVGVAAGRLGGIVCIAVGCIDDVVVIIAVG